MPITMETLKAELGPKWKEGMDPVLCPHKDAGFYRAQGYEQVGEVQDMTLNDKGTLLVFDRAPQREREARNRAELAKREAERRTRIAKERERKDPPKPATPYTRTGRVRSAKRGDKS